MDLPFEIPQALRAITDNRWLLALIYLVFFAALARLTDTLFVAVFARLARRSSTELDDHSIQLLHRPVFYSVLLIGIFVALRTVFAGTQPAWMSMSLRTVGIIIWGLTLSRLLSSLLRIIAGRAHSGPIQRSTLPLFMNTSKVLFFGGATYMLFLTWRIDISAWLASAGIIGIAVGFAAKDSLANLFSGIFIITDSPYRVGDYINLDTGERGQVTDIGLRSTRILTRDDVEIIIPNSAMGNAKIINESGGPFRYQRIRVPVGVAYGSDVDKVKQVLLEVASREPDVRDYPEPRTRFRSLGDSGLNFELMCWIELPEDRGRLIDVLLTDIYKSLGKAGIEIPYPKRDVYVRQLPNINTEPRGD
jgi:small-conductance mechanosensitive channel